MNKATEEDWRAKLSPEQYACLRQASTETPFSGALLNNSQSGEYRCAACQNVIFNSDTKYDSGSGWPSFTEAIEGSVNFNKDLSHGMSRVEVTCAQCSSHLGHVFNDRQGGGQRFCINSVCLNFKKGSN